MKARDVLLVLAGGAVALVIAVIVLLAVGGETATAPTPTTAPSQTASPTAEPAAAPNFEYSDVLTLTEQWVGETVLFPQETDFVSCAKAEFREGNRMWVVTCDFFSEEDLPQTEGIVAPYEPKTSKTYLFDDRTGDVQ